MKTLNLLVNDTVYTKFEVSDETPRSAISRELYERLYFHYLIKNNSIETQMRQFPNILVATFDIALGAFRLKTTFLVESEYGQPSVIGSDLLPFLQPHIPESQPDIEINENLSDAMARISYHYHKHHRNPLFDENVFFFDFDTIVSFAEKLYDDGQYDKVISLLTVLEKFVERKLYRDINNPLRLGAFVSARYFHVFGLAYHQLNHFDEAESLLISAVSIYSLHTQSGREIYNLISKYPY